MKKTLALIFCFLLSFTLTAQLSSCGTKGPAVSDTSRSEERQITVGAPETTRAVESTSVSVVTTAAPAVSTKAETTAAETQPALKEVNISTAADLEAISSDGKDYEGYTINFTSDIDLSGKTWVPMEGYRFFDATFNGNGHTVSGMTIVGKEGQTYLGFISATKGGIITFSNLTFSDVSITAFGKECAVIVGQNSYSELIFENVNVKNVNIDGYMDYNINSSWIAFRVAGFVGGNWNAGSVTIKKCSVSDFTATGFHNLTAFVGYDGVGGQVINITDSTVKNMKLTFSYCLSPNYKIDQKLKYVQVFYNAKDWSDTLDGCLAGGNTYSGVVYVDNTTSKTYDPETFRTVS